ncbi:unnamed protein product [Meloidogyne enterolobii]|uniref:Uncharacterized protein n=1 Tax=Meloidogyne enterolobii TaxID=390850 RepID=A0ACB0Z6X7_MELEN
MNYSSDSCCDPSSEDDGFRSIQGKGEDLSSDDSEVYDEVVLKSSEMKEINNKNKEVKVERKKKKKKKIIKTEVKKKNIKNVSKKKKNKRETRSRSNSTPENNFGEEEEENSPPTKLRHYLPRVAKDFTNAIKLSNATPQFQNQRNIGRRIRSDSGQSSRTYSRLIISVM